MPTKATKPKKAKRKTIVKPDALVFGYEAKQAFVHAYEWTFNHYIDWEDRANIARSSAFIAATILQEYINSRPKW
jgi:hypothetical protein